METGSSISPIVTALKELEILSPCQVRVFLSQRCLDRMDQDSFLLNLSPHVHSVLFYIQLRARKFLIVHDFGDALTGPGRDLVPPAHFWKVLSAELTTHLRSTQYERAIALTLRTLGMTLEKYVPWARHDST